MIMILVAVGRLEDDEEEDDVVEDVGQGQPKGPKAENQKIKHCEAGMQPRSLSSPSLLAEYTFSMLSVLPMTPEGFENVQAQLTPLVAGLIQITNNGKSK